MNHVKFIENKGQWEGNILYKAKIPAGNLYLESNKLTYQFYDEEDMARLHDLHHLMIENPSSQDYLMDLHAFNIEFLNAEQSLLLASKATSDYNNYYLGKDRSKWASNVRKYREVSYTNLYNNINFKFYWQRGYLKYDFIVLPGAKQEQIQLKYNGVDAIYLEGGKLIVKTSVNEIIEQEPIAYQYKNGRRKEVKCEFELVENVVSFKFPKGYDKTKKLIIDPKLVFASYTGSTIDNWGYTSTFDEDGNLYGGGVAFGVGYPTTLGAYQTNFAGGNPTIGGSTYLSGSDIAISKFSSDGTTLLYSTYLGGSDNESPHSLIVNGRHELLILGSTSSNNYPVTPMAYDTTYNGGVTYARVIPAYNSGSDIVISKLDANGATLVASTYMGGAGNDGLNTSGALKYNYADEFRGEIVVDDNNNVYVASSTFSTDFPVTSGAIQSSLGGMQDGCVFKLSPHLNDLLWSSYIGGVNDDAAYSLQFNSLGEILITGGTESNDFPTTSGSILPSYQGAVDGWIAKINSSATNMMACTYVGTPEYDQSYLVQLDDMDNVYVLGQTEGTYPITPASVYNNPNSGQFIHKTNPNLSTTEMSTVFGTGSGEVDIAVSAFLVNECNNILLSGWGGVTNYSTGGAPYSTTTGMPITPDAIQSTTDGSDYYLMLLSENATSLLYATFFGGHSSNDHVDGGTSRFDKKGIVYQAVCASCQGRDEDFPTSSGAWSTTNNSPNCNMGVFKIDLTGHTAKSEIEGGPEFCLGDTIQYRNLSVGAKSHLWNFGDGNTSTEFEPSHYYAQQGTYTVILTIVDSTTCVLADADTVEVVIKDARPEIDLGADIVTMGGTTVQLSATSNATIYWWSPPEGLSCTTCPNPVVTPNGEDTMTYYITAQGDLGGCYAYDTISIFFEGSLYAPNSFTVNGDGINEIFYIYGEGITEFELYIFDRWGELLYFSDDMAEGWDGTYEGQLVQTDTYVWKVKFVDVVNNKGTVYGTVTLLR